MSIPGSDDCYRRTPYCGGIPAGPPTASFIAGEYVKVNVQQNLNHFWDGNPGYFEISISVTSNPSTDPQDWVVLDKWSDFAANDMVSQMNFSRRILIPNVTCGSQCVLQVQYISNNADEVDPKDNTNAIFYNCADIEVTVPSNSLSLSPLPLPLPNKESRQDVSCCAPGQWQGNAVSFNKLGRTSHTIYYDATNRRVRWDRVGALENENENRSLTTITFYTPEPPYYEYLIDYDQQTCAIYGADRFYAWCYGSSREMEYVGTYSVGSEEYLQWQNPSNQFVFTAQANTCFPDSVHHEDYTFTFKEIHPSISDPQVFTVPSFCAGAERRHGCGGL